MLYFQCDYAEGAHPAVLKKLSETNLMQSPGYGEDDWCAQAASAIRSLCKAPAAAVHFLIGGTQTNLTVLAALLRPWQGVIAADTGHINVHEAGAIEAGGHKVLPLPGRDGKLAAEQVEAYCDAYSRDESREHLVEPGAVYISQTTEVGTCYTRDELTALSQVCRRRGLPLFMDGARLGYALAAPGCDTDLPFLGTVCDVFTLGGTKQGALFGEAVVLCNASLDTGFRTLMKQRGAMLAKGRLLGIQFGALLEDGLYFELSRHAVELALRIREALLEKGFTPLSGSLTNQQFFALPRAAADRLAEKYVFSRMGPVPEGESVRFCTSWATRPEAVDALIADIRLL